MTDFVTNDTGSVLRVTCKDNDTKLAINLTGSTVTLKWEDSSGVIQSRNATIVTPASGIVEYLFLAGELISPKMKFEVLITDSGSKQITNLDLIEVIVRDRI